MNSPLTMTALFFYLKFLLFFFCLQFKETNLVLFLVAFTRELSCGLAREPLCCQEHLRLTAGFEVLRGGVRECV